MSINIQRIQQLMDQAVDEQQDTGLQLAVYQDGTPLFQLTAGFRDKARTQPVTPDTLFPVFSAGKGIITTAAHILVQRKVLDYETRLADLWPEFAANGKQDTRLWHVLAHRAGLQHMTIPQPPETLADWEAMCRHCAAMTPAWQPGTKHAYHPVSFAWLLGHALELADGRDISTILKDEIITPLGLDRQLFFGTTPEADTRLADMDDTAVRDAELHTLLRIPAIRHACIPSFNGYMNANALAKHYAALMDDTDCPRLLTDETIRRAAVLSRMTDDQPAPDDWDKHGLGYVCQGLPLGTIIGHGGALGAEGFIDRTRHLAVGFTRNRLDARIPSLPLRDAISDLLNLPHRHW